MQLQTDVANAQRDIDRVGLSEAGASAMEIVMQDGHFKNQMACLPVRHRSSLERRD